MDKLFFSRALSHEMPSGSDRLALEAYGILNSSVENNRKIVIEPVLAASTLLCASAAIILARRFGPSLFAEACSNRTLAKDIGKHLGSSEANLLRSEIKIHEFNSYRFEPSRFESKQRALLPTHRTLDEMQVPNSRSIRRIQERVIEDHYSDNPLRKSLAGSIDLNAVPYPRLKPVVTIVGDFADHAVPTTDAPEAVMKATIDKDLLRSHRSFSFIDHSANDNFVYLRDTLEGKIESLK